MGRKMPMTTQRPIIKPSARAILRVMGRRKIGGRSGVMTPGWLSRWLLWEKKAVPAAVRAASGMHRGVKFKLD